MEFLRLLASIRTPLLNTIMLLFTEFGNETLIILVGVILLWCVDKKHGYFVLITSLMGTYINQFLKISCRIPRPWVLDPDFTIVEAAREAASGYSFPSGHTQAAVGCYASIALCRKETWVRIICLFLAVMVPFTRMYLGVHTPADVMVSVIIALCLATTLWALFARCGDRPTLLYPLLGLLSAMGVLFYLYLRLADLPADTDALNYHSALENAYKCFGCVLGMWLAYVLDRAVIRYETQTAVWWAQVLKAVLGILLLAGLMIGGKRGCAELFGRSPIAHILPYFIIVIFAGAIWPLTFKYFAKMGQKQPIERKES